MGIWNRLGDGLKQMGDTFSRQQAIQKLDSATTRRILERLESEQVREILKMYDKDPPASFADQWTGERIETTPRHWRNIAANRLTPDQLKQYCLKKRINIEEILSDHCRRLAEINGTDYRPKDAMHGQVSAVQNGNLAEAIDSARTLTPEATSVSPRPRQMPTNEALLEVLQRIHAKFPVEKYNDEYAFQTSLKSFLSHDHEVKREIPAGNGKIDLLLDGRLALEVIIARSRNEIFRHTYNIEHVYGQNYPVGVVVLDLSEVQQDIAEFTAWCHQRGVPIQVVRGSLKKKQRIVITKRIYRKE